MSTRGQYTGNPTYRSWESMKFRCSNPNATQWNHYGGRGVTVCERWASSFKNFLADMGERPSKNHSIDRFPNADGNYEPGNCRWATRQEQNNNQKRTIRIIANGQSITLREACRRAGVNFWGAYWRFKRGRNWRKV